jgi:hypothetical protein
MTATTSSIFLCIAADVGVFCNLRMITRKRRLHNRALNHELRDLWEYRVLAGLNGRTRPHPPIGKGEPETLLPRNKQSIERVSLFLRTLKLAVNEDSDDDALGLSALALGSPDKEKWLKWANQDLRRYKQYPQIIPDLSSSGLTTEMAFFDGDAWENVAIAEILWLLKEGQLFRIRICSRCKKWFYAMRDDQRFCDTKCRQKEHSQSPEFKAKRADYMRNSFRPQEKHRDERARKQAARVKAERSTRERSK